MTFDEYCALPAVNISSLLQMARSPAHYKHALENAGQRDTAALAFGRLAHIAILEPERYEAVVAVWDGGRRAGKVFDAWCEEHADCLQVTADEDAQCRAMADAVRKHPAAAPYLSAAAPMVEHSIRWTHPIGLDCKARLDWYDPETNVVVDLKTTRDASEFEFGRAAARYDYPTRAAFYCDGVAAVFGELPTFVLIAVEKEPPFAVAVYRIGEDAIDAGRRRYTDLLARLKHCRDTNEWPGLCDDAERELTLPEWYFAGQSDLELVIDGEAHRV